MEAEGDAFSDTSLDMSHTFNIDAVIESIKEESRPSVFWNFHSCDFCPYRTKSFFILKCHMKRHRVTRNSKAFDCQSSTIEKYKCSHCEFKTTIIINFKKHVEMSHRGDVEIKVEKDGVQETNTVVFFDLNWLHIAKSYSCESCDFKTYSQLLYISHYTVCPLSRELDHNVVLRNLSDDQKFLQWHKYYKKKPENNQWFDCPKCEYRANRKTALTGHMQVKHPVIRRKRARPPRPKNYMLHMCEICNFFTHQAMSLRNHILSKHTPDDQVHWYHCQECTFKTKWRANLYHHEKKIHRATKFVCAKCPYYSRQLRLLEAHIDMNHPPTPSPPPSPVPPSPEPPSPEPPSPEPSPSPSPEPMWVSKVTHLKPKAKRLGCTLCPFRTKADVALRNHMYFKHPNVENKEWYKCKMCSYQSKMEVNLKKHMALRHKPMVQCEICDFKTNKVHVMKRHVNNHMQPRRSPSRRNTSSPLRKNTLSPSRKNSLSPSKNTSWMQCELCPYKTIIQSEFREHIMATHVAAEAVVCFKCQLCTFRTIEEKALREHILEKHVDPLSVDWVSCEMCTDKFKQTEDLKKHIFEKHIL